MNVVLSRKEGASKVFYEGLAAGTPCIVLDDHEGVAPDDVNDRTGLRVPARDLASGLELMRDEGHTFDPRGWWEENASYEATTRRLEAVLRRCAEAEGRPWTRGLYRKKNDPNLCYADPGLAAALEPAYAALSTLLRPDAEIRQFHVSYERPA